MMDYDLRHGRTYMYFRQQPLYEFGYGLSYTSFEYSNLRTSAAEMKREGEITVSVDIHNTGSRAGDEVVQMYISQADSKVERPIKELNGFKRITLGANETATVQFLLKASALAYWDGSKGSYQVEPEQVNVMVGSSSANIRLKQAVKVTAD